MPVNPAFNQVQYKDIRDEELNAELARLRAQRETQAYRYGSLPYETAALDARGNVIGANRNVINARMGTLPIQQQQIGANRAVLGQNQVSLGMRRGLIGLQQQQLGAENLDIAGIRSARANVGDKAAVATEAQARAVEDQRYAKLGVAPPAEVDVQLGQEGSLPPNLRARLKTQEDIVRGKASDNAQDRAQTLQGAQLAVSLQDTNVTEAELAARNVGLNLAEANLMVTQAENQAALVGNDAQQADLALSRRNQGESEFQLREADAGIRIGANKLDNAQFMQPKDFGFELYTDPDTGVKSWMTRRQADELQYAYETDLTRQRLPESVALSQERTRLTQQAAGGQQNPFQYFDDSDIVQYLMGGNLEADSFEGNNRAVLIRQGLAQKYPGISEQALNVKMQQYLDSARREKARLADEGGVTAPRRTR